MEKAVQGNREIMINVTNISEGQLEAAEVASECREILHEKYFMHIQCSQFKHFAGIA